jgi:ligand-binding SRPBCC domain-containing protein
LSELRGPIVTSSLLLAPRDAVWARVSTAAGINDELWPLFRMTAPPRLRREGLAAVQVGQRVCRSLVLLGGVLPIDWDDITLVGLDPPAGFRERSSMLSQRVWEHERTLEQTSDGCLLTDRIGYQPRVAVPDAVLGALFSRVFRHRHRRLQRRFGGRFAPARGGSAQGAAPESHPQDRPARPAAV